jgi:hypothetical protein
MADKAPSIVEWVLQEDQLPPEIPETEKTATPETADVQSVEPVAPEGEIRFEEKETRAREEVASLLEGGLKQLAGCGFDLAELEADEEYEMTLLELAGDDAYSFVDPG